MFEINKFLKKGMQNKRNYCPVHLIWGAVEVELRHKNFLIYVFIQLTSMEQRETCLLFAAWLGKAGRFAKTIIMILL